MKRHLISAATFLAANAVGLLLAVLLLPGFRTGFGGFLLAVVIFSAVEAGLGPLIARLSRRHLPKLMGGIALVTAFVGLFVTDLLMAGMRIGGVSNWLAATLLVWLGSLVADIALRAYFGRRERAARKPAG